MGEYAVHTVRVAKKLEWFGLTILKRYLNRKGSGIQVEDVHNNPQYFLRGVDFILHEGANKTISVDVKVDSYFGSDQNRRIRGLCNPDSGFILLETISQLQYDRIRDSNSDSLVPSGKRRDVPGWFFTGQADEVHYYYIALLNEERELNPIYADYAKLARSNGSTNEIEEKLLKCLRIDRDLLVSFRLEEARKWYVSAPASAFQGFAAAPNPTYLTLSRRAFRDNFISNGPGKSHGSISQTVMQELR